MAKKRKKKGSKKSRAASSKAKRPAQGGPAASTPAAPRSRAKPKPARKAPAPVQQAPEAELDLASVVLSPRWAAALVGVVALLLYFQTRTFEYVLDDMVVIAGNRWVQQGLEGVKWLLTTTYWDGYFDGYATYYRPLSMITFAIEFEYFEFDPAISHLVNTGLYALTGVAVYGLVRRLTAKPDGSAPGQLVPLMAALLFVVSPLHVEVAANIKSRDEIMALLFNVIALSMALKWVRPSDASGWRKHAPAVGLGGFFLLALFTKESAITLVVLLPLTLYVVTELDWKRIGVTCAALVPGLVTYFAARWAVTGALIDINKDGEPVVLNNALFAAETTGEQVASALLYGGTYLRLLVWPHPLVYDYSIGQLEIVGWGDWRVWAVVALLVGLAGALVWSLRKRGDLVGWGLAVMAVGYAIPSNLLIKVEGATLAERYLYPATLGFCVLLPVLVARLAKTRDTEPLSLGSLRSAWPAALALTVLVGLWTWRSAVRLPVWHDNGVLIRSGVAHGDGNPRIVGNYAGVLLGEVGAMDAGPERDAKVAEVVAYLERQLELVEQDPKRYSYVESVVSFNLGMVGWASEDYDLALEHFDRLVELEPWQYRAQWRRGYILFLRGQHLDAVEAYREAAKYRPKAGFAPGDDVLLQDYYLNLCLAEKEAGLYEEALLSCDEALFWQKDYGKAWAGKGLVYQAMGDMDTAQEHYEKAYGFDPGLRP
jgi:hypothetical protein